MGIIFIVLGVINILLGGWLLLLGRFSFSFVLGLLITLIGYMYLTRPYFTVEKDAVIVPALMGTRERVSRFQTPDEVRLDGNKLMVRDNGNWKRVPVYRWMSDPAGWKALEDRLARQ
jgi:hypothetical protein